MNLDIDPTKILYAVGAIFGIAAVLYFARDIVFDLSITVRAVLLFLAFVVFLIAAMATERAGFDLVLYLFSAAAYLAFLTYTLSRFDVGADGTFLALLVSAILFLALGYLIREQGILPSPRTARYVIVGVALIAVVIVGADVVAGGVDYRVTTNEEGNSNDRGEVVVGTLTIDNRFVFREPIDVPAAFACIYIDGVRPYPVQYRVGEDRVPDYLSGSNSITAEMTVRLTDEERETINAPISIERAEECPAESEDSQIVVVLGDDPPQPPRPETFAPHVREINEQNVHEIA